MHAGAGKNKYTLTVLQIKRRSVVGGKTIPGIRGRLRSEHVRNMREMHGCCKNQQARLSRTIKPDDAGAVAGGLQTRLKVARANGRARVARINALLTHRGNFISPSSLLRFAARSSCCLPPDHGQIMSSDLLIRRVAVLIETDTCRQQHRPVVRALVMSTTRSPICQHVDSRLITS